MVFGGFGGRFFPSKPSNFIKPHQIYFLVAFDGFWQIWWQMFSIKAVKFHQTHQKLLMAFDGFWRFWWQIFSIKAVKPHQTSSNLIKYISWWSLMVFGGFDGRFFPPKPSNLIKDFLEAEIVPPNLSTPIKTYSYSL